MKFAIKHKESNRYINPLEYSALDHLNIGLIAREFISRADAEKFLTTKLMDCISKDITSATNSIVTCDIALRIKNCSEKPVKLTKAKQAKRDNWERIIKLSTERIDTLKKLSIESFEVVDLIY